MSLMNHGTNDPAAAVLAPRVAVVYPGDSRLADTRSGTPHGLARGLEAAGALVDHVSAEPWHPAFALGKNLLTLTSLPRVSGAGLGPRLRAARSVAITSPRMSALQTRAASRRLRAAGELAGVVQVGTGYLVPRVAAIATHDDMTVAQAVEHGYPQWSALPAQAVRARLDLQRRAYEAATACCVTSHWAAESVVHDYGISEDKVHVVGVGRNHSPEPLERDWSTPRFLFVGKDWERKNGPAVLRAFERLRRHAPEARLDLVGGHPPVDAEGVTGQGMLQVGEPAHRSRLDLLFGSSTCFVMPSWHEPFGIVFSEASAAGIPSIGTTVGGCGELIEPVGRVVHPADEDALLAAMLELADPDTARRLGAAARERAELFTWQAVGERMLRALGLAGERPLATFL